MYNTKFGTYSGILFYDLIKCMQTLSQPYTQKRAYVRVGANMHSDMDECEKKRRRYAGSENSIFGINNVSTHIYILECECESCRALVDHKNISVRCIDYYILFVLISIYIVI